MISSDLSKTWVHIQIQFYLFNVSVDLFIDLWGWEGSAQAELQRRIQRLGEMRGEMEAMEKQLERLNAERNQAQEEMDQLQNLLHSLDPSDPRHVSNTHAWTASWNNSLEGV